MAVLQITSREFRDNQKRFFDAVDDGKQLVIRRKNKTYALTPIEEEFKLSPEAWERIERSREQHRNGEYISCKTAEEAIKFLESL